MAVYANSVFGDFVYDDWPIIAENAALRAPGVLLRLLGSTYWGDTGAAGGLYRPLTMMTYALQGTSPFGFHLVNLGLHALVSALLIPLLTRLGASARAAFAGALCFAVLPIHTEAVASIVGRAELLSAVFLIGAWLLVIDSETPVRWLGALACFGLALFSKESAAVFPFIFILGEKKRRPALWFSFAVVLVLYLQWRYLITGAVFKTGGTPYFQEASTLTVWLTMAQFLWTGYIIPAITGLGLQAEYPPGTYTQTLAAWPALAASIGLLVFALRKRELPNFAVLIFLLALAPVCNLVFRIGVIGAERLLYFPSIGLCLLLGLAYDRFAEKRWAKPIAIGCLLWWGGLTINRNRVWASEEAFWGKLAEQTPNSARAYNGLGTHHGRLREHKEAAKYFQQALAINPGHRLARYNLAKTRYELGEMSKAETDFKRLVAEKPDADSLVFLGVIAQSKGDYRAAIAAYEQALFLAPYHPTAQVNLKLLLKTAKGTKPATHP